MPAAKKKTSKASQKPAALTYTKSLEEIPSFYVNNTNATVSAFDFKLVFGQIFESSDKSVSIDPQTVVFMSPQHAKAVADLLINQIKIYEEKTGQHLSEPPTTT